MAKFLCCFAFEKTNSNTFLKEKHIKIALKLTRKSLRDF